MTKPQQDGGAHHPSTTNDNVNTSSQNNDWDDVCLNPFDASLQTGREEGHNAGLMAGFKDGQTLGRHKGLELGIELGFIHGFATFVIEEILPVMADEENGVGGSGSRVAKIRKGLQEVMDAIDAFPTPDILFQRSTEAVTNNADVETDMAIIAPQASPALHSQRRMGEEDANTAAAPSTSAAPMDVTNELQRIRAKFKLLTVQLRIQQFSLKRIMDDVSATKRTESSLTLSSPSRGEVSQLLKNVSTTQSSGGDIAQHGEHDW